MKKYCILATLVLSGYIANAQTSIKLEEVKDHIGDSVRVCGKVEGGRFLESASNTPTLINVGAAFPNQLLTVVIMGEHRSQFTGKPENDWTGKNICVTGKIVLYKEKPQIVISKAEQVTITP